MEKWPILNQNNGLTPLKKISIFLTFSTSSFNSLERRFINIEYHKTHFPGLDCLKKKMEKWPILDQNHGLTPLKKTQFLDFLKFPLEKS